MPSTPRTARCSPEADYDRVADLLAEGAGVAQEAGDRALIARATIQRGQLALYRGNHPDARALLTEGGELFRELGMETMAAWALKQVGLVALDERRYRRASALIRNSLGMLREAGWTGGVIVDGGLEGLAAVSAAEGNARRAARLLGAAVASRRYGGQSLAIPFERSWHERTVEASRKQLPDEEFAIVFDKGRAMSVEEALEYALRDRGDAPAAPEAAEGPTLRAF